MKATDSIRCATQWSSRQLTHLKRFVLVVGYAAILAAFVTESSAQGCNLTAEEIVGPANLCTLANSAAVVSYSVSAGNASGYTWTVPTQAVFISGQGTPTILIRYKRGFVSGSVSVNVQSHETLNDLNRNLERMIWNGRKKSTLRTRCC